MKQSCDTKTFHFKPVEGGLCKLFIPYKNTIRNSHFICDRIIGTDFKPYKLSDKKALNYIFLQPFFTCVKFKAGSPSPETTADSSCICR